MKIRNGFVSNSSTSSFLLYGTCIEDESIIEKAFKRKYPHEKFSGTYDAIEKLCEEFGLEYYCPWDYWYIGKSWSRVEDTETGSLFKERVRTLLESIFVDEDLHICTHEEAWHD